MSDLVVGAFSSTSQEFLVPFFVEHCDPDSRIRVIVTAFRGDGANDYLWPADREYIPPGYAELPLPPNKRLGWPGTTRDFISLRPTAHQTLHDRISLWIDTFSYRVGQMLGGESAARCTANGAALLQCVPTSSTPDAAEAVAMTLRAAYQACLADSAPPVAVLHRSIPLECSHNLASADRLSIRALLNVLARAPSPHGSLHKRGMLVMATADGDERIESVIRLSSGRFRCTGSRRNHWQIDLNQNPIVLADHSLGAEPVAIKPYGVLTLVRLTSLGSLAHAPWYAKVATGEAAGPTTLSAREFISPISVRARQRSGSLGRGGLRITASGSSLLDYDHEMIYAYIASVLGTDWEYPQSRALLSAVVEGLAGAPVSARGRMSGGRLVVNTLLSHYRRALACGLPSPHPAEGISRDTRYGAVLHALRSAAILDLVRRHSHPQSEVRLPPASWVALCRAAGVSPDNSDVRVLLCDTAEFLLSVVRSGYLLHASDSLHGTLTRLAAEVQNMPSLAFDGHVAPAITSRDSFCHLSQLLRNHCREVAAILLLQARAAILEFLQTDLWTLLILLGPDDAREQIRSVCQQRVTKWIEIPITIRSMQ